VNGAPDSAVRVAYSRTAAPLRSRWVAAVRAGMTGSRSRVRASMRALVRDFCFLFWMSPLRMGQGTAHGRQNAPST
jgi:hypothetical protein